MRKINKMKRQYGYNDIQIHIENKFDDDDIILNILSYMNMIDLLNASLIDRKWRLFSLSIIRNDFINLNNYNFKFSIKDIEKMILDCFNDQKLAILYQKYYIM